MPSGKLTRRVRVFALAIILLVLSGYPIGFFLKNYITNHSQEWICRKVSIGSIYINPLTTSLTIQDLKIFESNNDSVFFSFDEFHVNAVAYKAIFHKLEIEEITLDKPQLRLAMKGNAFNFDDLMACHPADSTTENEPASESSWAYAIENIALSSGQFTFYSDDFNAGVTLEEIESGCELVSSDSPFTSGTVNFGVQGGGTVRNFFNIRTDSLHYNVRIEGDSIQVGFLYPFIEKVLFVSGLKGRVDTRLTVGGKMDAAISEAVGFIRLSDFEMTDTANLPSLKAKLFEIGVDTVSAIRGSYSLRRVLLDSPYFRFGLTSAGNTLMRPYQETKRDSVQKESEEEDYMSLFRTLNHYFLELGKEYAIRYYAIDTMMLRGGKVQFDDYTLAQRMRIDLDGLSFNAMRLNSEQDSIKLTVRTGLNRSGRLNARLVVMPKDTGDLVLTYTVDSLKVSDFSPYSEYYVAHPFWDGIIYFNSNTTVVRSMLNSKNHLFVKHIEVGDKVDSKTAYHLPLKFAVALLKDVDGNIDLNLPMKGNVNDPKFSVFPVVVKIFRDLIVKAAASPYKLLAKTFNASEEDLRDVKYDYLQSDIRKYQTKSLNLLARVLNQKTELTARLVHVNNPDWEMKQYALFEVRRRFYAEKFQKSQLTFSDSLAADRISRSDSAFVSYLKEKSSARSITDVESVCVSVVGETTIKRMLADVNETRVSKLTQYLTTAVKGAGRFQVEEAKPADKANYTERPKFIILFDVAEKAERSVVNR